MHLCKQEMLQSVTQESTELSSEINNRKQMLAKIEDEIQRAEEVCYWSKYLTNFRTQLWA